MFADDRVQMVDMGSATVCAEDEVRGGLWRTATSTTATFVAIMRPFRTNPGKTQAVGDTSYTIVCSSSVHTINVLLECRRAAGANCCQ